MNDAWIDALEMGSEKVRGAVAGLSPAQLKSFPVPGTWSIQQIVMHLVDSDMIGADRIKRIIALQDSVLQAYDENTFTNNLHYHEQSIEDGLEIMRLNGLQMGRLLRCLPESAFSRQGIHTEVGPITLKQMLERDVKHVDHHLKFIHEKRKMVQAK